MKKPFTSTIAHFADLLMDAVCMVDAQGRFVFVSAAGERIFGYTQQEMIGMEMIDLVAPADRERTLAAARSIMDGQPNSRFENRYIRKDGQIVHIMWSARWSEADQLRVAVARDITVNKRTEAMQAALYAISEAAHASDDLPALFQRIHQIIGALLPAPVFGVALCGEHGQSLQFAYHASASGAVPPQPLAHLLGEEVLRSGLPVLVTPATLPSLSPALQAAAGLATDCWIGAPLATSHDLIGVLLLQSGGEQGRTGYTDQDEDLLMFVSNQVATAIHRKQLHTRLRHMAQHDELTQLPNRRLFHDRLVMALARAQRHKDQLSLLFIDLNKFKQINDYYGHACGDLLLREVAQRLKRCVREADTVARLGGDEFVIILEEVLVSGDALQIKEKIHQALAAPVLLADGRSLAITASIGVAHYPEHGADIQQLVRHADQSMYKNKLQKEQADQAMAGFNGLKAV
ncbi:diguanylate cyclase domain-containing protein [Duganella sp. LjRoot269]|jgi:diguanylate cyclase (GGDEF)-like protein/PAS domain S-box-containing protein|uniref:sensor domain-containing protein n=1 Tax=Duganella sp. LjRoot269 TaxID=3342305 RepID=UPI003ED03C99